MLWTVQFLIWFVASVSFVEAGVVGLDIFDEAADQRYQLLLVDEPIQEVEYDDASSSVFLRQSDAKESKVLSNLEWKQLRRFINRQLKVPRRYWNRIVRNFNKVVKLRSADGGVRRVATPRVATNRDAEFFDDDERDYFLSRDILSNRCRNLQFLRNLDIGYYVDE